MNAGEPAAEFGLQPLVDERPDLEHAQRLGVVIFKPELRDGGLPRTARELGGMEPHGVALGVTVVVVRDGERPRELFLPVDRLRCADLVGTELLEIAQVVGGLAHA